MKSAYHLLLIIAAGVLAVGDAFAADPSGQEAGDRSSFKNTRESHVDARSRALSEGRVKTPGLGKDSDGMNNGESTEQTIPPTPALRREGNRQGPRRVLPLSVLPPEGTRNSHDPTKSTGKPPTSVQQSSALKVPARSALIAPFHMRQTDLFPSRVPNHEIGALTTIPVTRSNGKSSTTSLDGTNVNLKP